MHAGHALSLATRTGARKNLVKARRLAGAIAMAERRWDEAEASLAEALALAEAIANPPQLWKAHAALAALHRARGRSEAAALARRRARNTVEAVHGVLTDPHLRDSLARGVDSGAIGARGDG